MLNEYEKKSLSYIFSAVKPENIISVIELLKDVYKNEYNDNYSISVIQELERVIIKMNHLQQQPKPKSSGEAILQKHSARTQMLKEKLEHQRNLQ